MNTQTNISQRRAPVLGRSGTLCFGAFAVSMPLVSSKLLRPGRARSGRCFLSVLALLAPAKLFACAACYGANIDSPMADGMNWAILTLGVVITTVLGGFLTFLIYAIRKSEALTAAAEKKNYPEVSKV